MQAQLCAPKPRSSSLAPPFPCCSCRYRCFGHRMSWVACFGLPTELTNRPSPRAFPLLLFICSLTLWGWKQCRYSLQQKQAVLYFLFFGVSCLWRKKCRYEGLSLVGSSSCRQLSGSQLVLSLLVLNLHIKHMGLEHKIIQILLEAFYVGLYQNK